VTQTKHGTAQLSSGPLLKDPDAGFKWLALAVEERSGWIAYLQVDPRLDHLHTDPRFTQLIPAA